MKTATIALLSKVKDAHQLTTSYQAAKLLGLNTTTVYNWVNKKGSADDDTARRMCELAGEDPAYWLPLITADRTKSPALKAL